jgi:exopolysaccharide biosynthesis protein
VNQDASLRVLRSERVTIDGNPPALIHSRLGITRHAVHHGRQLGAKKKDVDTAVSRDTVESLGDRFLELAMVQITNKIAVDVDRGAALQQCQSHVTEQHQKQLETHK